MGWPVGTMVMLVVDYGPDESPPAGAYGEVIAPLDSEGDYEVLFPHYLCPVPPGEWWFIPAEGLIRIGDKPASATTRKEECLHN